MMTAFLTAFIIEKTEFIYLLINILQTIEEVRQDKVIKCKTVTKRQKMPREIKNFVECYFSVKALFREQETKVHINKYI